jgi:2-oxoglutarate/2-oxoacid ferredoxin oxidoreductase subunit alpha
LGTENGVFWNSGDEHDEEGHISEDPVVRTRMMDKRMRKLDVALKEISDEDKILSYGNDDVGDNNDILPSSNIDLTLISWGSTKGAILDAMDQLNTEGKRIKFIQVKLLHPFPAKQLEEMLGDNGVTIVDIEMNYSSQLGLLFEQNLNRNIDYRVVKYNGRPMSSSEIYNALMWIIDGDAPRRIVLKHGT